MLYNKEWDQETKPDIYSLDGLIAWLEAQRPEKTYDFFLCDRCLIHMYLVGVGERRMGMEVYVNIQNRTLGSVFETLDDYHMVALSQPWTFGAALDRARKLKEKSNG